MVDRTIRLPGREEQQATDRTVRGDLTPRLIATDWWSDAMLVDAEIPVIEVPFVTVGGGIGSFVTVDYLRIYGVPPESIRVLASQKTPWESYEYLTRVSQIPRSERIRSDSSSCPDNIWGFPSYAIREAFSARSVSGFCSPLWQVLVEPIFRDYYTPKAGQVFAGLQREHDRISYGETVVHGQVRMIRRRVGGGYFTILTPPPNSAEPTRRIAYRSRYVHVAVGYPGLKFLPDLQNYRSEHRDFRKVVNAYESHEHVYEQLKRKPGRVLVRGGGIVASRVLQRLIDDRDSFGLRTQIVHLFRTYITGAHGPNIFMRRKGGDGWAYQGFNYPKSVWGGQLKAKMRKLEGEQRAQEYKLMGGTNTPVRRLWQNQLKRGRREGWYTTMVGEIDSIEPAPADQVRARIKTHQGMTDAEVDFIIDCTGLEADIREHRVLADLLDHGGAGRNPIGRLDVERNFEVCGTRSEPGMMFASGSATLGGYFPGVDTFLGLQIAAQEIADELAKQDFCHRLRPGRSISQWLRWARNRTP
jgi:pSer/pThr/pTyr-binding forkhead associated (FHA) protein